LSRSPGQYRGLRGCRGSAALVDRRRSRSALVSPQQISDDLLVLPTAAGVVAFDRATGDQRWTAQLSALPIDTRVVGGSVHARTIEGTIVAPDRSDGHQQWRADVGQLHVHALSRAEAERLFVAGHDGVVALDATTGNQLWQRSSDAVVAAPVAIDDVVYVGTFDGDLLVLDAATGAELARLPPGGSIFESPTLSPSGLLLVASDRQSGSGLFAIRRGDSDE
jgi:outer membrane protein assembly factor BamB